MENVSLDDWAQTVALFAAVFVPWTGFVLALGRWLLNRVLQEFGERHSLLRSRLERIEGEHRALVVSLPEKYVQRDDWIRMMTMIDAKMDALNRKLDDVKEKLYERN